MTFREYCQVFVAALLGSGVSILIYLLAVR